MQNAEVVLSLPDADLEGTLTVPAGAGAIVVFAHGSGSSRLSPRNRQVAGVLRDHGLGTLLFDLLTSAEDRAYETRFDIDLLTERLLGATRWLDERSDARQLRLGYFGSSTGAAAALRAAARADDRIGAIVSRGGRVDLADAQLPAVRAPTLLIVGGEDHEVLALNRAGLSRLECEKELHVVPGAGHLFDGPGELEEVAEVAAEWFATHLD